MLITRRRSFEGEFLAKATEEPPKVVQITSDLLGTKFPARLGDKRKKDSEELHFLRHFLPHEVVTLMQWKICWMTRRSLDVYSARRNSFWPVSTVKSQFNNNFVACELFVPLAAAEVSILNYESRSRVGADGK